MGTADPDPASRGTTPSRRLVLLGAALLIAAAGAVALARDRSPDAETSRGASEQLYGAQTHPFWTGSGPSDVRRELDLAAAAGLDVVRVDLAWSSLEPERKGRFSRPLVAQVDRFLDEADRRGIRVIATLWGTPCWASSAPRSLRAGCLGRWWDRGVDRHPPRRARDYADAAAWTAARWGGRLEALEVWNEPNLRVQPFLRARDPARAYAAILRTAYPRIKRAAPRLTVVAGALAFADAGFLERLYDLGLRGSYDALSIHPYSESRSPAAWSRHGSRFSFAAGIEAIRALMVARGDGDVPLWLSEVGWSTCTGDPKWCVSAADQASFVADAVRLARRWPFVRALIVYNLRDKGYDRADRESGFGLVRRDYRPKPAYDALRRELRRRGPDRVVGGPPW
ncbi:MAG TPA: cellulase family glycosylhydrolase [Thermoleophilaceae bacterium]